MDSRGHLSGARHAKVVETVSLANELTVAVKVLVRWKLPKMDPNELYRLRYVEGIAARELAKRFERAPDTIFSVLGRYKRERGLK